MTNEHRINVTLTASGPRASGKSTILSIIAKNLQTLGLDVVRGSSRSENTIVVRGPYLGSFGWISGEINIPK